MGVSESGELGVDWSLPMAVDKDTTEDLVQYLVEANDKLVGAASEHDALFASGRYAEFVFACAGALLPAAAIAPGVRHRALCIFSKYMLRQVKLGWTEAAAAANADGEDFSLRCEQWRRVAARLSSQLPLRCVTALHMAHKLHRVKGVNMGDVVRLLRQLGHDYTKEQITGSEVRMLSVLENSLPVSTAVDHVHALLKVIQNRQNLDAAQCGELERWALLALDAVALRRTDVCTAAATNARPQRTAAGDQMVADLCADDLMLACAALCVASAAVDGLPSAETLTQPLHQITGIEPDDMADLSSALIKVVFSEVANVE